MTTFLNDLKLNYVNKVMQNIFQVYQMIRLINIRIKQINLNG